MTIVKKLTIYLLKFILILKMIILPYISISKDSVASKYFNKCALSSMDKNSY